MGTLQGRVRGRVMDLDVGQDGVLRDAAGTEYSMQEVLHPAYDPAAGLEPQGAPVVAAAGRPMTPVQVTVRRENLRSGRHEVHEAVSADGQWRYRRAEHTGTLWDVEHVPTGLMREGVASLPKARAWTSAPGAVGTLREGHQRKLRSLEEMDRQYPGRPDLQAELARLRQVQAAAQDDEGAEQDAPTHAGVALVAGDTGRLLMLQRSYADETDPARGLWELPGGGIEDGEAPEDAARREWTEEIGQEFPADAELRGTWNSPDGVYRGHIFAVPEESVVELHEGRVIPNPDDPGGDDPEQAAWWLPADAKDNPALRPEVADSPWGEIEMAGGQQEQGAPHEASLWDAFIGSAVEHGASVARQAALHGRQYAEVWGTLKLAQFGDLDVVEPDVPAEEAGVDEDPEHALPTTYGEADIAPVASLSADWRQLRQGPTVPATVDDMRAGTPVIAPCGCLLSGTNSSARQCQVAPAGVAPSRDVVRHLADVRRAGRFSKAAGLAPQAEQVLGVEVTGDPYAHLLEAGGGGGDEQVRAAAAFLGQRTALKDFSPAERQEIINEGSGRASNLDRLDLTGTHYHQMGDPAEDDEWMGFL